MAGSKAKLKSLDDNRTDWLSSCPSCWEEIKYFLYVQPARRSTGLKACKKSYCICVAWPSSPTGKHKAASRPMAVTSVVRANWQDHGKFLTMQRSSCKMSSLSFTLIYHFTGLVLFGVCPAKASIYWCHCFKKDFYDKICFFVHCTVFHLFGTNPVN